MTPRHASGELAAVVNHHASCIARRKALADALAGVIASLVSLWAFYPVDVYKTHLQATHHDDNHWSDSSRASSSSFSTSSNNKNKFLSASSLICFFRGWHVKSWHTVASNFCYFYLESWMTSRWIKLRRQRQNQKNESKQEISLAPLEHLVISALAAMLNNCLTLPLDVISLQSQAVAVDEAKTHLIDKNSQHAPTKKSPSCAASLPRHRQDTAPPTFPALRQMDNVWNSLEQEDDINETFFDCRNNNEMLSPKLEEEKKDDHNAPSSAPIQNCSSSPLSPRKKIRSTALSNNSYSCRAAPNDTGLVNLLSLWKGLVPSLLLCSNPSIHYTVYDLIKNYLLLRQNRAASTAAAHSRLTTHLTWAESFGTGVIAKLTATLVTYPLIRAKVLIIMKKTTSPEKGLCNPNNANGSTSNSYSTCTAPTAKRDSCTFGNNNTDSLVQCVMEQYQQYGLAGLYRGCSIQILHTVLKSALIMMIREQITDLVHGWLMHKPNSLTKT